MAITDTEKAYQKIKTKIIKTELMPGTVVKEAELMEELSFGRTPIREAIKQLQIEGLVIVKPRRGVFVSDISITDLLQLFEMRIALETLAARLATERITPGQLIKLRKLADRYENADLQDKHELIDLDGKFHSLIAEASRNKFLHYDIVHYYNLSTRIWYLAMDLTDPEDIDVQAHLKIRDAIVSGKAEKAMEAVENHIKDFHKTIKTYI